MSNQMLCTVANDSVDQLQVAREHIAWLESLAWAASTSLKAGHDHHAKQLAGAASYLAGDYKNCLDSEIQRLSQQLTAADLRT